MATIRRPTVRVTLVLASTLALLLLVPASGRTPAGSLAAAEAAIAEAVRPNLIVFLTDDQRASNTLSVMPNVKRYFIAEGRRYTNGFDAVPLCCPGRATIYSGRYSHNNGVRINLDAPLLDQRSTVQRQLQDAGYATGYVGKYLNNWSLSTAPPYFNKWATIGGGYTDPWMNVNGQVTQHFGYTTDLLADQSLSVINQLEATGKPWALYVAPSAPHNPWTPAPRHATTDVGTWQGNPAVFETDRSDKPQWVRNYNFTLAQAELVRTPQLRTLLAVDDLVGRVQDRLSALGLQDQTLQVYTSDNGYVWADHKAGGDYGTAGQKRFPYTASVKVPTLLRYPGVVASGRSPRRMVSSVDIAPTLLDAAGVTPDATYPMDGYSLLSGRTRASMLLEYWNDAGAPSIPTWKSIRTPDYQYVEYYGGDGDATTIIFREYYDQRADPWQLTNLLADGNPANDPDIAALHQQLLKMSTCRGTSGDNPCP